MEDSGVISKGKKVNKLGLFMRLLVFSSRGVLLAQSASSGDVTLTDANATSLLNEPLSSSTQMHGNNGDAIRTLTEDCTLAPDCAKLHREDCVDSDTPHTCGPCLSGPNDRYRSILDRFSDGNSKCHYYGGAPYANLRETTGPLIPFDGIDVGTSSNVAFWDADGDGDADAFVGENDGNVNFFENTGTFNAAGYAVFTEVTGSGNPFHGIDVGLRSNVAFWDADGDGDADAFVGESDGTLNFFKNTGTFNAAGYAVFTEVTGSGNPFHGIDVGGDSNVAFWDADGDGDADAFVGAGDGTVHFFKNTGTFNAAGYAVFTEVTGSDRKSVV